MLRYLTAAIFIAIPFEPTHGAINSYGNVDPIGPSYWKGTVGDTSFGAVSIDNGSQLSSSSVYLGQAAGATGLVSVDGAGSSLNSYGSLQIGLFGAGLLAVTNQGMLSTNSSVVGNASGATGLVTIDGSETTWSNANGIYVGSGGAGTVSVTNGGKVETTSGTLAASSGTGMISVDGAGSIWSSSAFLWIGSRGHGVLAISNGGEVNVDHNVALGIQDSGSGAIHLNNGTLTAGSVSGDLGNITGTGDVYARGIVSDLDLVFDSSHGLNRTLTLNEGPGQNVTLHLEIDGSGSMGVGWAGTGTMTVRDGSIVNSANGYVGWGARSQGTVAVAGPGSIWATQDELIIGQRGRADLTITHGGIVRSGYAHIGNAPGSTGSVSVEGTGSAWINQGAGIGIGSSGVGSLRVLNGGFVHDANVALTGIGYDPTGQGRLIVDGANSQVAIEGQLDIGHYGVGIVFITNGGLIRVGEGLAIDVAGDGDSFVNMASNGKLALAGDAEDSLMHFLELIHGTAAIRYWDDEIGQLASLTTAISGDDYTLEYLTTGDLAGYTLLTVTAPGPEGDFDRDFDVDGADFLAWQRGESPAGLGPSDLRDWQANYGWVAASAPSATAVPEPAGLLLALAGITMAILTHTTCASRIRD